MNITPIKFNFIQPKLQRNVSSPLRMKNVLTVDTVSFSGNIATEKKADPLDNLVPKHKGIIYKKVKDENGKVIKKIPVEVDIENTGGGLFTFNVDGKQVGGAVLSCLFESDKKEDPELVQNYPKEGIVGDRIYVNYILNNMPDEYSGIGHLSDLLEVAACKEVGFDTNIVSFSRCESSPLHYLRGKRFIPFKEYDSSLYERYDNKDPDEVIKDLIDKTPKGQKIDTSEIKDYFIVYMPKDMAKGLEEELKENPIF